ncbi:MAG TPA: hypothetical protein VGU02_15320 [Gaiellaceae bacterium]|nr:hypothetical protein [Gaiellaceae bacterium]
MNGKVLFCAAGSAVAVAGAFGTVGVSAHPATAKTVTVAMHDPGCHWFQVGTSFRRNLMVKGPVSLLNIDEATLKVAGPFGTTLDPVGKRMRLARGTYRITMVGQAPDDNNLKLVVT